MIYQAELESLADVDWEFFVTLSLRSDKLREEVTRKDVFALLRSAAALWFGHSRKFPILYWCLRVEFGEQFGRRHYHLLIGGAPKRVVNVGTCFWLMHRWEKKHNGGFARCSVFDNALNGVGYVTKCLEGGDHYESRKFGSADYLILSHSFASVITRRSHAKWQHRRFALNTQGQEDIQHRTQTAERTGQPA